MSRFRAGFETELTGFAFDTLERDAHSVFALSADLELTYFNPAYGRFTVDNGFAAGLRFPLGRRLLDFIRGPQRAHCEESFRRVLATGTPWHHEYDCHSGGEFREFFQGVYPREDRNGLVVVNSLKVSRPMGEVASPALEGEYLQPSGSLTQCGNCRRTQRNDESSIWDWVPAWVSAMPSHTSHSLCPTCFDYYWKHQAVRGGPHGVAQVSERPLAPPSSCSGRPKTRSPGEV